MPLLDAAGLLALRLLQETDAALERSCHLCSAQTWRNYCRQCDETFEDGHYKTCERASHQDHRRY